MVPHGDQSSTQTKWEWADESRTSDESGQKSDWLAMLCYLVAMFIVLGKLIIWVCDWCVLE